jgi:transcriptional regulator with XRE-family HTH domain
LTRESGERKSADVSFGRWLQRRRKALDITQAELGKRVGYASVTIHKIETDQLRPSREMASRLADELAIPSGERSRFLAFARQTVDAPPSVPLPGLPEHPGSTRAPYNVPVPSTRLLGREKEVRTVCTALRGETRLVTLTGPGGIGKTRLALEIASVLVDHFADGVVWMDLAPVGDPALLQAVVTAALGARDSSDESFNGSGPLRVLANRAALLVFDNL